MVKCICETCGKEFDKLTAEFNRKKTHYCSRDCYVSRGSNPSLGTDGYYSVWKDGNRVRVHVLVWEKENGTIPKGYHIHHIDFDKKNNDINNLRLMMASDHHKLHREEERKKNPPKHIATCSICGNKKRYWRIGNKKTSRPYRCRKCLDVVRDQEAHKKYMEKRYAKKKEIRS